MHAPLPLPLRGQAGVDGDASRIASCGSLHPSISSPLCSAMSRNLGVHHAHPPPDAGQLVVLHPDHEKEWKLCCLVVKLTRVYLSRGPLLHDYQQTPELLPRKPWISSTERLKPAKQLMEDLGQQVQDLKSGGTNSDQAALITRAWKDWISRNVVFKEMSDRDDPLYRSALHELLGDLLRFGHKPDMVVAVLVSLTTMLTETCALTDGDPD